MGIWRKPTACGESACLEVSTDECGIAIRESMRPGTVVVTSRASFAAFVAAAKAGEYDDLCGESHVR